MIGINVVGESEAVNWPLLGLLCTLSKFFYRKKFVYFVKVLFVWLNLVKLCTYVTVYEQGFSGATV